MPGTKGFHKWRWRTLFVWVLAFTAIVSYSLHIERNQAKNAENLSSVNFMANIRQERTIRLLCDDLYVINNLVTAQITAAEIRLGDHLAKGLAKQAEADSYLIRNFDQASKEITSQLVDKDSPCVSP